MTSVDVTMFRILVFVGIIMISLVFIKRNIFEFSIKLSVSMLFREEYSYDQNHWWPEVLIVILGILVSSIKYNVFRDGMAINTSIKAGKTVQIVSISCPSIMNLLNDFLTIIEIIKYSVRMVIRVRMIIAWS